MFGWKRRPSSLLLLVLLTVRDDECSATTTANITTAPPPPTAASDSMTVPSTISVPASDSVKSAQPGNNDTYPGISATSPTESAAPVTSKLSAGSDTPVGSSQPASQARDGSLYHTAKPSVSVTAVPALADTAITSADVRVSPTSTLPVMTSSTAATEQNAAGVLVIGHVPQAVAAPGLVCPATYQNEEIGLCSIGNDSCLSDSSCRGGKICCRKGCGRVCMTGCEPLENCNQTCLDGFNMDKNNCSVCACKATPAPPAAGSVDSQAHKPRNGTCPDYQPSIGLCSNDMAVEICVFDTDCTGRLKCCRRGCGRSCVAPCFEPDCSVSCTSGYKVDENSCVTCECQSETERPASEKASTTRPGDRVKPAQVTTANLVTVSPTQREGRNIKMELEVIAAKNEANLNITKLVANSSPFKESLQQQLQSQFGMYPGQLEVTMVKAASTEGHLLVLMILAELNSTTTAAIDDTVKLMAERTNEAQLWLTYQDTETKVFYRLRSVGILSIATGTGHRGSRKQVVGIVVAIMGLLLLILILSIIAFVNWRADRRKKLLLSGAQRHSTGVQFDNIEGATFVNPFVPQLPADLGASLAK